MASANLQQTVVKLNVGGARFETSLSTLTRYPESMFATWFANWSVQSKAEYFVDFDGSLFKHILEFLRFGEQAILPKDERSLERLLQAADYFQLPRLHAIIASLQRNKLQNSGTRGLHDQPLAASAIVKLSSYGSTACVESLVADLLGFVPTGRHPRPLPLFGLVGAVTREEATNVRYFAIRCPSCFTVQLYGKASELEPRLSDALVNSNRDVFANQLSLAQFEVTQVGSEDHNGNCVVIAGTKQFSGKSFHVAKSFLCAV